MFTDDDQATMQLVRRAFDPLCLANPGKVFPTPSSCGESHRRLVELRRDATPSPLADLEVI